MESDKGFFNIRIFISVELENGELIPMLKKYFISIFACLLFVSVCRCQNVNSENQMKSISNETNSIVIEDGGTGIYKAIMVTDTTLATHTIFRPKDLSPLALPAISE